MVETVRGGIRRFAAVAQGEPDGESEGVTPRPGLLDKIKIASETEGFAAAEYLIAKHEAHLWSRLSKIAEPTSLQQALIYAERAFDRSPPDSRVAYARRAVRLARDIGGVLPPDRVLEALLTSSNPADVTRATRMIDQTRVWRELAEQGFPIPEQRETPAYTPIPAKVVYCLHNSLPYDSGGYATRSHGVLRSVERAGLAIVAYTRLGYPWDSPKRGWKDQELDIPDEEVIDGIVYRRMPTRTEGRRQIPVDRYMRRYAEALEAVVRRERPAILHAASAFLVGVPTVAVARGFGIPSVYEVRGLWELTHISRDPRWAESEQHDAYVRLETEAALAADAVLTLTNALKRELIRRGVPEEKITVVPNSVDTDRFVPLERDTELARQLGVEGQRIVGYVGSFVDYEGLDDLLHAAALVLDRGTDFRLLLVGDGVELPRIRALVEDLELTDHVIMPGRVPFEDVQRYYSLVDVAAFPRKPWPVTEMVSPMKPFEAMAMEKALLVSSVDALTEIVADGETGVVFEKGNIDSLVDALERMVQDPDLCVRLGKRAREWVVNNRRWDQAAATIREVYRNIQQPIPLPRLVPVDNAESDLWERLTTNPREIARQAAVLSYPWDGRILDIGMGHGYVASLIARAHQPELIVGVDVEMRWAKYARKLARANGIENVLTSAGTAEALPFGDRSFDRVIITQVLEHVDRPDNAIREIARVLKPEGSVLIAVPSQGKMPPGTVAGHVQDFSIDEMLRMIREAGLEVIEHRKVGVREFYFVRPAVRHVLPETAGEHRPATELSKRMQNPNERERHAAVLSFPWNGRVLDVGVGHGHVASQIALIHHPELIVGIDLGVVRVRGARKLARSSGADSFEVAAARGERLPFAPESFDRVHLSQVMEHVNRPDDVLGEVARVLKPGGTALIAVPGHGKMPPGTVAGHVQDFTIEEMQRLIEAAGLETVEHRTVGAREFHFVRRPLRV